MDGGDPFSDSAVARFRRLPGFRETTHACAKGSAEFYAAAKAPIRWVFSDRGRYMTGLASIALLGMGALTAANLKAMMANAGVSSPGRVAAFLSRTRDEGLLVMGRDATGALERRLEPSPALVNAYRAHRSILVDAIALMRPEVAAAQEALASEAYPRIETAVCLYQASHREQFQTRPGDPLYSLIERSGTLPISFAWLAQQPLEQEHLFETAVLNAAGLWREFGVSRIHVERFVADLEARGLVTLDRRSRLLSFAPTFSEAFEATTARIIIATYEGLRSAGVLPDPAHF